MGTEDRNGIGVARLRKASIQSIRPVGTRRSGRQQSHCADVVRHNHIGADLTDVGSVLDIEVRLPTEKRDQASLDKRIYVADPDGDGGVLYHGGGTRRLVKG